MEYIQINPIKDSTYQSITLTLSVKGATKRVNLELKYEDKTDRWYMSLFDIQTGETYFLHIPLLSSPDDSFNDLFLPFRYKNIGFLVCFPKSSNVETENPSKDNLNDFYIIWGDEFD